MGESLANQKTWRQWDAEKIDGISIKDPDGFERDDPMMDLYVYTRTEFLERRARCTVGPLGNDPKH